MKFLSSVVLMMTGFCISCGEPSEIGSNFFQEGSLDLVYTDTVSIIASTVLFDSLVTSRASRFLIGHHVDEDLGSLTCKAFFSIEPDASNSLEEINTTYSRLSLLLTYDKYSYYDTSELHTLFVHRVTEDMEAEEDGNLYNTSSFEYDPIPLGQRAFLPRPNKSDSLEIALSDDLGRELYDLSKISSNTISDADDFQDLINGLVVSPDTVVNGTVLGFSTDAELRVYYIDRTTQPTEEKYFSFSVSGSSQNSLYFNEIISNKDNTSLQDLKTQEYSLSSDVTNERAYIQGGSGLAMRIELPYIKTILLNDKNLIISAAYLEIRPIHKSDRINTDLPRELLVYNVNQRNEIISDFQYTPILVIDEYLNRDSYYQLDIEEYIKQQLSVEEFNSNALLLTLNDEDMASSVTRLFAGDQKNEYEMEIKIHMITVNSED